MKTKNKKTVKKKTRKKTTKSVAIKTDLLVPKDYAHKITDANFPDFFIKKSSNAWWMSLGKVEALIGAFKIDATIEEALVSAGITYDQFRYFREEHPEFSQIIDVCRQLPNLRARRSLVLGLDDDPKLSLQYLKAKKPQEFSSGNSVNVGVQVNMADNVAKNREEFAV